MLLPFIVPGKEVTIIDLFACIQLFEHCHTQALSRAYPAKPNGILPGRFILQLFKGLLPAYRTRSRKGMFAYCSTSMHVANLLPAEEGRREAANALGVIGPVRVWQCRSESCQFSTCDAPPSHTRQHTHTRAHTRTYTAS